jgi:hypothetical protein
MMIHVKGERMSPTGMISTTIEHTTFLLFNPPSSRLQLNSHQQQ